MASRNKSKGKLDARFRGKPGHEPAKPGRVWTAARVSLAHSIAVGDDFERPDLIAWLEEKETLASRTVPQGAPDDALLALYEVALLRARRGAPTVVKATDPELVDALKDKLPQRPSVRLDEDALRGCNIRIPADVPHELDASDDRPMLRGAKVTAGELGPVLHALAGLNERFPWRALAPWGVEFVVRAPTRDVPDGSLLVQHDGVISWARSVAARDHTLTWPRGKRPRGMFFLDVVFHDPEDVPAVAREAVAQGWRAEGADAPVVYVCASDIEDVARPLVRSDLDVARLFIEALAGWCAEERPLDPGLPTPLTVDVATGVTLEVRATHLVTLDADNEGDWLATWGPSPPTFARPAPRHDDLVATLRGAGDRVPKGIEARVVAAGADAVPALCDALVEALADPKHPFAAWWILLALGRLGDLRSLPSVVVAGVLHNDRLGEFLTEGLPPVFTGFGPAAIPQLTELLASPCLDPYLRVAAGTALFAIGVDHPEARPRIVHVFTALFAWFDEDTDPDVTVATLLASRATRMGDDAVYQAVVEALEEGVIDDMHINADDLARIHGEAPWTRDGQGDLTPVGELLRLPYWAR